jgi:hypothetical protein
MMYPITMREYDSETRNAMSECDSETRSALSAYNSKINPSIAFALIIVLPIVLVLAFIWA